MIARLFRQLGMFPVGYYDLSTSGVPVHATAFRPVTTEALDIHPFRVFTSLLRPELIVDEQLRAEVEEILEARDIFHPTVKALVAKAEEQGGILPEDAKELVEKALETFKWHERALVTHDVYDRMKRMHPLLADIAGFRGPHINHLTPRVLDIDLVQRMMGERGLVCCHLVIHHADPKAESLPNEQLKVPPNVFALSSSVKHHSKLSLNLSSLRVPLPVLPATANTGQDLAR